MAAVALGSRDGWTFYQQEVSCAAGSDETVCAAVTGKLIRLMAIMGVANVAGTLKIFDGTSAAGTQRSGTIPLAASQGFVMSLPAGDVNYMCIAQASEGAALVLLATTCTFNGVAIYAVKT